jgi:hypothetical protein
MQDAVEQIGIPSQDSRHSYRGSVVLVYVCTPEEVTPRRGRVPDGSAVDELSQPESIR